MIHVTICVTIDWTVHVTISKMVYETIDKTVCMAIDWTIQVTIYKMIYVTIDWTFHVIL